MKNLNIKFMEEVAKIKDPVVFLGIARILKVRVMEDGFKEKVEPRDFMDVFTDCVASFSQCERKRKKELLTILKKANCAPDIKDDSDGMNGGDANGDRAEDTKA